ncbi:hypothetical protein [Methylopila sp. M107]|uniref:hypothetical protein n=1 Tax=Methylopila sp. M107 TaxID=1101190 RepID=UPI0003785AB3|nr:hypothetical protein [Methylopila sp. M107]
MTTQVLFDTARFRDRLTSSGMPDLQARAVTEGFEDALRDATATKSDLDRQSQRLDGQIDRLDGKFDKLDAKIDSVEERLDAKIDAVEERLSARIALLDESVGRRIAEAIATQSRWIIASLFGGLGLLFAALKLFP